MEFVRGIQNLHSFTPQGFTEATSGVQLHAHPRASSFKVADGAECKFNTSAIRFKGVLLRACAQWAVLLLWCV
jgi:hypothetical protein